MHPSTGEATDNNGILPDSSSDLTRMHDSKIGAAETNQVDNGQLHDCGASDSLPQDSPDAAIPISGSQTVTVKNGTSLRPTLQYLENLPHQLTSTSIATTCDKDEAPPEVTATIMVGETPSSLKTILLMPGDICSTVEVRVQPEQRRYNELNEVIASGLNSFVDVGLALSEVKQSKLYKIEFESWDGYLRGKWDMKRSYASRLIKTAPVANAIEKMLPNGNISDLKKPTSEAQVRPLLRLKTVETQFEAWKNAHGDSPGKAPTKDEVHAAVVKMIGKPSTKRKKVTPTLKLKKGSSEQSPTIYQDKGGAEPEKPSCDPNVTTARDTLGSHVTNAEVTEVTMVDGSVRQTALSESTYVDAKLGQNLLDKVCKQISVSEELQLKFQGVLLDFVVALNYLVATSPTKETRNATWIFIRDILYHVPNLAAKPGDREPAK